MIIIGFEGLDKSGKRSQSELLYKALYERGYNVQKSEFHRYDTPTGQLIRRFLDGEYQPGQYAKYQGRYAGAGCDCWTGIRLHLCRNFYAHRCYVGVQR